MSPVVSVTGRAVPLDRSDVDTDQIFPSVGLQAVHRAGMGRYLFAELRNEPGFVMEDARYRGAAVMLAGPGFGTGSSREHAVWALVDAGFQAVISPRFGALFRSNALANALIPAELPEEVVARWMSAVRAKPEVELHIDVVGGTVRCGTDVQPLSLTDSERADLARGHDPIAETLALESALSAFEASRPAWMPAVDTRSR